MYQESEEPYSFSNKNKNWLQPFLWLFIVFFSLVSSLSFSFILYLSVNNEWDIAKNYSDTLFDFFIATFPLILLLPFVFGFLLAIAIFKFTSIGKNLSLYLSFSVFLFSIFILAFFWFYTGIDKRINSLAHNTKIYELITQNRLKIWQTPDFGLLSGEVASIDNIDNFLLVDFNNKVWTIHSNEPKITNETILYPGAKIKIIGKKNNQNTFEAKEIKIYQ